MKNIFLICSAAAVMIGASGCSSGGINTGECYGPNAPAACAQKYGQRSFIDYSTDPATGKVIKKIVPEDQRNK